MTNRLPPRDEVPVDFTWDIASIFPTPDAWETAVADIHGRLDDIAAFQGRLAEGAATLADWFALDDALSAQLGRIFVYANSQYNVNMTDQAAATRRDRARALAARVAAAAAFAEPEMLAIGFPTLRRWVQDEPRLAAYGHHFDRLEKRQMHVRSAEVEEVMGLVQDAFGTAKATHAIMANADLNFAAAQDAQGATYEVGQGSVDALLAHADRHVRRTAYESYRDGHLAFKNSMANALVAGVKQHVFRARVRDYTSALAASLEPNHIPVEIFQNLLAAFRRHLPTWHRYWRVRRQVLGYDALHEYDIKAPLVPAPNVAYEQAVDWIAHGMRPLGAEYVNALRHGSLEARWVDIYPNRHKRMGAYSTGVQGTHPFILMSYVDNLYSLSTLAHELGHSLHSYFTWQSQPQVYSNYGLFVAEVASNFNQALVRAHLLAEHADDPRFQIAVLEEAMSNYHRYLFIMPTLARFELAIHERIEQGQSLSADDLIGLMADLLAEGYGGELDFDRERIGITWATFHSHLYANFYVYQYATGIAGALALANGILNGRDGAAENYLSFLSAGSSLYPLDALRLAGVDMTAQEPVETAFNVLGDIVDQLAALVDGV